MENAGNTHSGDRKTVQPDELVLQLYKRYEARIDPHLWPWETKRWHELVFCLLTTIAEPELSPETTREVTRALAEWRLLDIDVLAGIHPSASGKDTTNPILVTIATILQQVGFEADKSTAAVAAICDAASGFQQNYESKVQKYFRKYGAFMLEEVTRSFSFSRITGDEARRAIAIWLQNTLNMPVPASNPITDAVCKRFGVEYSALLKAADDLDINIALLDEALRAYWEDNLEEEEFLPAKDESSSSET